LLHFEHGLDPQRSQCRSELGRGRLEFATRIPATGASLTAHHEAPPHNLHWFHATLLKVSDGQPLSWSIAPHELARAANTTGMRILWCLELLGQPFHHIRII
jgi:hypothetical protein